MREHIAHIKRNVDGSWAEPHLLRDHLLSTSELASKFAEEFKNRDWAEIISLLHDLGKYHPDWQKYIRRETCYFDEDAHIEGYAGRPNHSVAAAIYLFEWLIILI